jgi:hypothetical protein
LVGYKVLDGWNFMRVNVGAGLRGIFWVKLLRSKISSVESEKERKTTKKQYIRIQRSTEKIEFCCLLLLLLSN